MSIAIPELPIEIRDIVDFLFSNGYYLTAVGGCVRDLLFFDKISLDWDFEIRSINNHKLQEEELKKVFENISKNFQLQIIELPYCIFKFNINHYEFEISCPRREIYTDNEVGHKNFEAILDSSMNYIESFKRRDLTINALGVEYIGPQSILIDPYSGLQDGRNAILKHISSDFSRDPVRLLRLIRFCKTSNFKISEQTKLLINKFDLSKLSWHYIVKESKDIGLSFLLLKIKKISIENNIKIHRSLKFLYEKMSTIEETNEIEDIFLRQLDSFELRDFEELEYFNLSKSFILKAKNIKDTLLEFKNNSVLTKLLKHCEKNSFEELLNKEQNKKLLKSIKILTKKYLSHKSLVLKIADIYDINLNQFENYILSSDLVISADKLDQISPALRQDFVIYKKLRKD
ncbi:MAG: CCA tRNA nucleotidyltransferase [Halobacteriovoraceae bacterium]|nr:CCA tRNA nucleotidyltransferase [Halobacteriovoraceae bacterium]